MPASMSTNPNTSSSLQDAAQRVQQQVFKGPEGLPSSFAASVGNASACGDKLVQMSFPNQSTVSSIPSKHSQDDQLKEVTLILHRNPQLMLQMLKENKRTARGGLGFGSLGPAAGAPNGTYSESQAAPIQNTCQYVQPKGAMMLQSQLQSTHPQISRVDENTPNQPQLMRMPQQQQMQRLAGPSEILGQLQGQQQQRNMNQQPAISNGSAPAHPEFRHMMQLQQQQQHPRMQNYQQNQGEFFVSKHSINRCQGLENST